MRPLYPLLLISMLVMLLVGCSEEVPANEELAEKHVRAQGYAIESSMHEVTSYTFEKSKLAKKPDSTPLQQIWGVQKTAPDAYLDKEISIYGFTVSGHPLEKPYKARTKVYIMISQGQVIGGYSFPDIERLNGAVYSLNGKTQEEVTGLSYEEWTDHWKEKYGP